MHFICFRFCLLCCKLDSVGHYVCGKQHYDAIPFSRNLEMACCTTSHSCWKCQYKDFRVLGCQSEDRFIFIKTKHPIHIIVLRVITSNVDVMSPSIFPCCLTLNTEAYIKGLEELVLPWIQRVTAGRYYVWKQDSMPSRRTCSWLWENICDHITSNI